jgi:hypothetical protein
MARYNLIQIGSEFLTLDGLITGRRCKTEVPNLAGLLSPYAGNTIKAASGKPYTFLEDYDFAGLDQKIIVSQMASARFAAVNAEINAALASETTISVIIDGDLGVFDLNCVPLFSADDGVRPIQPAGRFRNGFIFEVTYNFSVESINSP